MPTPTRRVSFYANEEGLPVSGTRAHTHTLSSYLGQYALRGNLVKLRTYWVGDVGGTLHRSHWHAFTFTAAPLHGEEGELLSARAAWARAPRSVGWDSEITLARGSGANDLLRAISHGKARLQRHDRRVAALVGKLVAAPQDDAARRRRKLAAMADHRLVMAGQIMDTKRRALAEVAISLEACAERGGGRGLLEIKIKHQHQPEDDDTDEAVDSADSVDSADLAAQSDASRLATERPVRRRRNGGPDSPRSIRVLMCFRDMPQSGAL